MHEDILKLFFICMLIWSIIVFMLLFKFKLLTRLYKYIHKLYTKIIDKIKNLFIKQKKQDKNNNTNTQDDNLANNPKIDTVTAARDILNQFHNLIVLHNSKSVLPDEVVAVRCACRNTYNIYIHYKEKTRMPNKLFTTYLQSLTKICEEYISLLELDNISTSSLNNIREDIIKLSNSIIEVCEDKINILLAEREKDINLDVHILQGIINNKELSQSDFDIDTNRKDV